MRRVVLAAAVVGLAVHTHVATPAARYYWPTPVKALATGASRHTHVAVTGRVTYVNTREDDGDTHLRVTSIVAGDTSWVIAECIPKLPCRVPKVGEVVTVKGISRKDSEHGWWEVHPVEEGP